LTGPRSGASRGSGEAASPVARRDAFAVRRSAEALAVDPAHGPEAHALVERSDALDLEARRDAKLDLAGAVLPGPVAEGAEEAGGGGGGAVLGGDVEAEVGGEALVAEGVGGEAAAEEADGVAVPVGDGGEVVLEGDAGEEEGGDLLGVEGEEGVGALGVHAL